MSAWLDIFANAFWCGCAALGFGVLFSTPRAALVSVWLCGFVAGLIKFTMMGEMGTGMIFASWMAASAVGFASIPFAHQSHVPPLIVSIPAVIPLVPGSIAYRTMLGLIRFIDTADSGLLTKTIHNGSTALFVLLVLSVGLTLPMLLFRIESVKNVQVRFPWSKK